MLDILTEIGQSLITSDTAQDVRHFDDFIPLDPQEFYEDFGVLEHPRTGLPVPKLAPYQYQLWRDGWRYRKRLAIKSQKIGISTSHLMEDFQKAITKDRGRQILIISQTLPHAKEHLYSLRKMILGSEKYSKFMITKPTEVLLKDEITKVHVLFLHNPLNPYNPTRVIGLGPKEAGVWSWTNVGGIHMSDVAAISQVDDSGLYGAASSRLANTMGWLSIETPPRGQRGFAYKLYTENKIPDPDPRKALDQFKVYEFGYLHGIASGIITAEYIEEQRKDLGVKFGQYFDCQFLSDANSWYSAGYFDDLNKEDLLTW